MKTESVLANPSSSPWQDSPPQATVHPQTNKKANSNKIILLQPLELDSNPYISLYRSAMHRRGWSFREANWTNAIRNSDAICHLNWPEWMFNSKHALLLLARTLRFLEFLIVCRLKRHRLIWTVHNIAPHLKKQPEWLSRIPYWLLIRNLAGVIFLSRTSQQEAIAHYPSLAGVPSIVLPHGAYPPSGTTTEDLQSMRRQLGISNTGRRVVGYFGLIKDYKGVDRLIESFRRLPKEDLDCCVLAIAGACPDSNYRRCLEGLVSNAKRDNVDVRFLPRFLTEAELDSFISLIDVAVTPFTAVTNSGSVIKAFCMNKPVIVPAIGSMVELQQRYPEWISLYDGELTAQKLGRALKRFEKDSFMRGKNFDQESMSWDRIAGSTETFLQGLS